LRRRCLRFPSLVTCTTVDWFHAWPKDALVAVAHSCLNKLPQLKEHDAAMVAEAKALATSSDKRRSTLVAQSKGTGGDAAGEGQESKLAENLAHHMATIHCGVQDASTRFLTNDKRFTYAPPASFLELIESFAHLLRTHSSKVGRDIERLERGVATLAKTAEAVESLKDELEFKQVEVESKRQAAEDVLREMGNKSAAAEAASEAGASEREKAEEYSREALSLQTQAAGDLASAEPFLEEAKEAVEALTAELMSEFKALKKLPSGVDKVAAAVLMLVKNERKDFSWENAKVMVSRFDSFVGKLASTTGEHIDPEVVHRVQPILDDPMFTFEKMRSKSEAAGHLCKWVHSITSFHKVYRRVQPLMAMLAGAQEAKAQAGLDLEAVEAELRRLDRRLAQLKLDFVTAMREKQLCEDAASSCGQRLRLAERLTSSLQSERERWGQRLDTLRRLRSCVAGDAMLSAAFATYAGPFTAGLRTALNGSWAKDLSSREVPLSTIADPLTLLAPPASVAAWQACGLPKERMCCENGAVLLAAFSSRWPLLIDPQGQGVAFVKAWENKSEERDGAAKAAELEMKRIEGGEERRSGPEALTMAPASADAFQIEEQNRGDEEGGVGGGDEAAAGGSVAGTARSATTLKRKAEAEEGRGLVVLHTSQPRWLRELSAAVSAGLAVVLQGLGDGTPPACLDPLLRKAFYRKGRSVFVGLCGQEVEYDPSFRLYLQTTLANPHFTPEVCARCRLVNFAVSQPALEAQILSLVVTLEQPELEEERAGLTETFTRHKQELRLLEDGILARLAHAPPDLLSETALIDTLENCKEKASAVEAAVVRAHKIEAGVERVRLQYRSLATEAAGFYFLASALSLLHPLYRFSLSLFLRTLARSVSECDEADEVPRRVSLLRKSCRQALFLFVRRGLFEKHRLAFQAQAVFQFMGNDKEHFEAVELRKAEKERQRKEANGGEDDSGEDEDEDEVDEFGNSVERLNVREWSEAKPKDTGFSPQGVAFLLNSCAQSQGQSQGRQVAAGGSQGVVDPLSSRPSPAEWLSETSWRLAGLLSKEVAGFSSFQQDLSDSAPRFLEWFEHASPESEKLPLEWRLLDNKPFKKLLAIRVLRPDRFGEALHMYARRVGLGKAFTNEADSSLSQFEVLDSAFLDASSDVPVLLALSKGSDALSDVHRLAAKYGLVAGTSYHCVSLGSGQTALAEVRLWQAHRGGHWVLLSDAHLAPRGWLETCLWLLASFALEGSHPNFRVVFTADATAASGLKDQMLPIALLEACVVVVYDPPGGVKGKLKKALCSFDRDALEELEPMHRGALFGLCHFHSAMAERRRYGAIGFNEGASYSWGGADLRHSASLLESLMADAPVVPWAEVRHLLGSAVHGGHVSDPWDQRVVSSYLGFLMKDGLNEEMELFPFADTTRGSTGFTSPTTSKSVKNVLEHVDKKFVQSDTCLAVGLHPNNEIALKTDNTLTLLTTLRDLERVSPFALGKSPEPDDASLAQGGVNPIGVAEMVLQDVTEQIKGVGFDLGAIESACVTEGVGPFQHVYLNECARLNELVGTMAGTLGELDKGLKGELAMSDAMELLLTALATDKVPTPWRQFPSLRNLTGWLVHVSKRIAQMAKWERKPTQVPVVTWISGLFNPVALLSAIMQQSARDNVLELDQLVAYTEVTKKHDVEDFPVRAKDGCYCVGLTLEGARYTVNSQTLEPQLPRKLLNKMPVICLRAKVDERADGGGNRGEDDDGGEGGGGSGEKGMFECPVYMTQSRGLSEFVFSAGLRTRVPSAKWVLAGVALVMDAADVE